MFLPVTNIKMASEGVGQSCLLVIIIQDSDKRQSHSEKLQPELGRILKSRPVCVFDKQAAVPLTHRTYVLLCLVDMSGPLAYLYIYIPQTFAPSHQAQRRYVGVHFKHQSSVC